MDYEVNFPGKFVLIEYVRNFSQTGRTMHEKNVQSEVTTTKYTVHKKEYRSKYII